MCTALIFSPKDHYFGRNLDLELSFGQEVVIAPRNYEFKMRKLPSLEQHYALIGVALVKQDYPLYFDAANEKGLAMAGLNYPGNARYYTEASGKDNVAPFEFIPWILGQASNIAEAKQLLAKLNLVKIDFSPDFLLSPLHWLLADKNGKAITVEADRDGMHVYDNPVGVLTNNPSFPLQSFNLNNYQNLAAANPQNSFSQQVKFDTYSRGLGSRNLPGGLDSESRFVRACFGKYNALKSENDLDNLNACFHIMHSVEQVQGLDEVAENEYEYTIYTSCVDLDQNKFYYTTYQDQQIKAIDLGHEDLNLSQLKRFAMQAQVQIAAQN
jgi:choloylglycine hydrolase